MDDRQIIFMMNKNGSASDRKPIPVLVIGGFLGAGKTTLLNYILSENHGIRAGVLVNDFGAINIDAKLVVGVDGDTVSLANGCVCCSIREDLLKACMSMVLRSHPPDLLIIETSGVSEPFQVANTFLQPEIEGLMALDSVLTIVDADQFPGLMRGEMGALARKQVQDADMIVLNKVDLVDARELATVKLQLQKLVPRLRIFDASHGRVPLGLVMGSGIQSIGRVRDGTAARSQTGHQHGHPFSTWHWTSDRPLSLPRLRSAVEALPDTVYRLKGIVYLEEFPSHQVVLQMVGRRYSIGDTEPWGFQPPQSEIVLIASRGGFNSEALQGDFDDCIGTGDEASSPILRLNRFLAMDPSETRDVGQGDNKKCGRT
jgi:G3E family GTPase